jgi:Na+-driven multidrug efflux pump
MFRFGGENVFSATVINFTVMGIFYASFPACLVLVPVFISKYLGINQFEKAKENAKLLISFVSFIGLFITVLGLISSFFVNNIIKFTDKFDYGDNKLLIELTTYYIRFQSIAIAFQLLTQVIYAIVNSGNLVKLVLFLDLLSQ